MTELRPYRPDDAAAVLSWIRDERSFRLWSADRYNAYPITPEEMNAHYVALAGSGRFFPMTMTEEGEPAGHLILRYPEEDTRTVRLGFIIVDSNRRGRGLGKTMLGLAARHAFAEMGAERVTLGVFADNIPARRCYLSAGFREVPDAEPETYRIMDEDWLCIEMEFLLLRQQT